MTFTNFTDSPDDVVAPNFGGGILLSNAALPVPAGTTHFPANPGVGPMWYVGNAVELLVVLEGASGGTGFNWNLDFYSDVRGANKIWGYQWAKNGFSITMDTAPVLGPFCSLTALNGSGSAQSPNVSLSERVGAASPGGLGGAMPGEPGRVLAVENNAALAAGTTDNIPMVGNLPGPAYIYVRASAAVVLDAIIQIVAGSAAGQQVCRISTSGTAVSAVSAQICLPNDDWELRVANNGGVATNALASVMTLR